MKSAWLSLAVASVISGSPTATSQVLNPSARQILASDRTLLPAEVAIVLAGVRETVSGKTLRLSYLPNGPGPEVQIGPNGRARFVRAVGGYGGPQPSGIVNVVTFTDFTGRAARKCDGTALNEDLVIEYEHKSTDNRWTVRARTRELVEPLSPAFDILSGSVPATSGSRRSFDDRTARALVAPWKPPDGAQTGGPLPAGTTQSLWIDIESLLPLRWSISMPPMPEVGFPGIPDYGLSFTYDSSLALQPPDATLSSDCVR